MHYNSDDLADEFRRMFGESAATNVEEILKTIKNPLKKLGEVADMVHAVIH